MQTRPVQIRLPTNNTSDEYVTEQTWVRASLQWCPEHPGGGCGFARHGTYRRAEPSGCLIARYYCPLGKRTYSLLPDCLAARLPGDLAEVETVVATVEASRSLESAAALLRPDIELPGAIRWTRRRVKAIRVALLACVTLFPQTLPVAPTVTALRAHLKHEHVLQSLRDIATNQLHSLGKPLGFFQRTEPRDGDSRHLQHNPGPDTRAGPS